MGITESKPMSVADAMKEMRRPMVQVVRFGEQVIISLYPYGMIHGGTAMNVAIDPDTARAVRDRLNLLLED